MTAAPATPQSLGRYEVLGEIASGGMATVYLARVRGVQGFTRRVAVKKIHRHLEREQQFARMFIDEARLAARIHHPNVVATLDIEDQDGLYIVMEYIEGESLLGLQRVLDPTGARMPTPVALRVVIDVLSGLHAAHELRDDQGEALHLVHRDVSPHNVLVGRDGITRITDFGIAHAKVRLTHTAEGAFRGKVRYMAPEQLRPRGHVVDRRADVFAAGIVLWETLTGVRLFQGDDMSVVDQLLNLPIPWPRERGAPLPDALEALVMRALDRDPTRRFATAAEFADALEDLAPSCGGLATPRKVAEYIEHTVGPLLDVRQQLWSATTSSPPAEPEQTNPARLRSEMPTILDEGDPTIPPTRMMLAALPVAPAPVVSAPRVMTPVERQAHTEVLATPPPSPMTNRRQAYIVGGAFTATFALMSGLLWLATPATPTPAPAPHVVVIPSVAPVAAPSVAAPSVAPVVLRPPPPMVQRLAGDADAAAPSVAPMADVDAGAHLRRGHPVRRDRDLPDNPYRR